LSPGIYSWASRTTTPRPMRTSPPAGLSIRPKLFTIINLRQRQPYSRLEHSTKAFHDMLGKSSRFAPKHFRNVVVPNGVYRRLCPTFGSECCQNGAVRTTLGLLLIVPSGGGRWGTTPDGTISFLDGNIRLTPCTGCNHGIILSNSLAWVPGAELFRLSPCVAANDGRIRSNPVTPPPLGLDGHIQASEGPPQPADLAIRRERRKRRRKRYQSPPPLDWMATSRPALRRSAWIVKSRPGLNRSTGWPHPGQ